MRYCNSKNKLFSDLLGLLNASKWIQLVACVNGNGIIMGFTTSHW